MGGVLHERLYDVDSAHDVVVQQRNIDDTVRGWYDSGFDRADIATYLLVSVCMIADNYGVSREQLINRVHQLQRRPTRSVTRTPRHERTMGSWWERKRMERVNETHAELVGSKAPKISEHILAAVRGWHDAGYDRIGMIKSLLVAALEITDSDGTPREEPARVIRECQMDPDRTLLYTPGNDA